MLGGIGGRRRRGRQRMRWLNGTTDWMQVNFVELLEFVMDREAQSAAIHGVSKSWTRLSVELNCLTLKHLYLSSIWAVFFFFYYFSGYCITLFSLSVFLKFIFYCFPVLPTKRFPNFYSLELFFTEITFIIIVVSIIC